MSSEGNGMCAPRAQFSHSRGEKSLTFATYRKKTLTYENH